MSPDGRQGCVLVCIDNIVLVVDFLAQQSFTLPAADREIHSEFAVPALGRSRKSLNNSTQSTVTNVDVFDRRRCNRL